MTIATRNRAQALGLVTVEPGERDGPLVVQRRLDGGRRERLALPSPAVVSFEPGPELRRASLAATLAATTAVIEERAPVSSGSEADLTVTARRPFRPPPRIVPAPQGSTRQRLDALLGAGGPSKSSAQTHDVSPEEAARLTVEHLLTWGYLDPERVTLGGNAKGC